MAPAPEAAAAAPAPAPSGLPLPSSELEGVVVGEGLIALDAAEELCTPAFHACYQTCFNQRSQLYDSDCLDRAGCE